MAESGDLSESFTAPEAGPSPVSDPTLALHRILSAIAERPLGQDAASELLAVLSSALETSSCHAVVLETDANTGAEVLVPLASAGQYGALVRDMPAIDLDSPLEAAQVFRSGRAHFVDELHMTGEDKAEGTARWRAMIATQSFAVLPLVLHGQTFGVLTLQWSLPVAFDEPFREALHAVATIAALEIVRSRHEPSPAEKTPEPSRRRLDGMTLSALGSQRAEGGTEPESVLVATVDVLGSGEVVLAHAEPEGAPARLLLLAPSSAGSPLPEIAAALADTAVALSASPRQWLDALNRSLPTDGGGVSAWGATFDPRTGALMEVSAGVVSVAVANAIGGEHRAEFKRVPLGVWSEETYAERPRMLLPGDRLEACLEDGPDLVLEFLTRAP